MRLGTCLSPESYLRQQEGHRLNCFSLGLRDQVVDVAQNFPWFTLITTLLGLPLGVTGLRRTSEVAIFALLALIFITFLIKKDFFQSGDTHTYTHTVYI